MLMLIHIQYVLQSLSVIYLLKVLSWITGHTYVFVLLKTLWELILSLVQVQRDNV